MSGRPKQKRYQYDRNGRFIREFESESDCRREYYSNITGKYPMFNRNGVKFDREYHILPDDTFLFKERVGRVGVRDLKRRLDSKEFLNINFKEPRIKCLNLDNKVVATFANINIAHKMTNIPIGTIWHSLKARQTNSSSRNLIFKYE